MCIGMQRHAAANSWCGAFCASRPVPWREVPATRSAFGCAWLRTRRRLSVKGTSVQPVPRRRGALLFERATVVTGHVSLSAIAINNTCTRYVFKFGCTVDAPREPDERSPEQVETGNSCGCGAHPKEVRLFAGTPASGAAATTNHSTLPDLSSLSPWPFLGSADTAQEAG